MYRRPISLSDPMAAQSLNLTVVDVYDLAASIGKEFETIIDNYGPEVVTELMPKVINVLEHLEILSTRNQKENAEINDLKYTIERLHAEKKSKAEERARFEEVSSELSVLPVTRASFQTGNSGGSIPARDSDIEDEMVVRPSNFQ